MHIFTSSFFRWYYECVIRVQQKCRRSDIFTDGHRITTITYLFLVGAEHTCISTSCIFANRRVSVSTMHIARLYVDSSPRNATLLLLLFCMRSLMFIGRIRLVDDSVAIVAIMAPFLAVVLCVGVHGLVLFVSMINATL